jgi:hypothetical protein
MWRKGQRPSGLVLASDTVTNMNIMIMVSASDGRGGLSSSSPSIA